MSKNPSKSKWLSKEKLLNEVKVEKKKSRKKAKKDDSTEEDLLDFSVKKSKRKRRNSDYEKYGITFPTVADVMKDKKDLEKFEKEIDEAKRLKPITFSCSPLKLDQVPTDKLLTCKNLTNKELIQYFISNIKYLENIINGTEHSEAHECYKKEKAGTSKFPKTNLASLIYTTNQMDYLLDQIDNQFTYENQQEYSFNVMLPELCLKIFMDVHKMNKKEAQQYLNNRPSDPEQSIIKLVS